MKGQSSVRAQHNATLQLGLERVLSAVRSVASSENTRDHHQHMLIIKSGELKSKMNELFLLLEGEDYNDTGAAYTREMTPGNVEEIVSKSKELASQLRKEASCKLKPFSLSFLSPSLKINMFHIC